MRVVTLDPIEETWREAFDLLMRFSDMSNLQFAELIGCSGASIQGKRTAAARIRPAEVHQYADALGVPVEVFSYDRAEVLRWLADRYAAWDSNPEPTDYETPQLKSVAA